MVPCFLRWKGWALFLLWFGPCRLISRLPSRHRCRCFLGQSHGPFQRLSRSVLVFRFGLVPAFSRFRALGRRRQAPRKDAELALVNCARLSVQGPFGSWAPWASRTPRCDVSGDTPVCPFPSPVVLGPSLALGPRQKSAGRANTASPAPLGLSVHVRLSLALFG